MSDNKFNLTLEEIVNTPGRYQGENFAQGVCFDVSHDGMVFTKCYNNSKVVNPSTDSTTLTNGLFTQKCCKIFNRGELLDN